MAKTATTYSIQLLGVANFKERREDLIFRQGAESFEVLRYRHTGILSHQEDKLSVTSLEKIGWIFFGIPINILLIWPQIMKECEYER